MNSLLEEIQQLRDCADEVDRARWLLSVPLAVLMKYRPIVERNLEAAGDQVGLVYVAGELDRLRQERVAGTLVEPMHDKAAARNQLLVRAGFRAFEATEI